MKVRPTGETALLVELPTAEQAQQLRLWLLEQKIDGLSELVPGLDSLLIDCDTSRCDLEQLTERLGHWQPDEKVNKPARQVDIPVYYDGPDLDAVAKLTGLSHDDVIERHQAAHYRVAFLGFAPGFPYLIGLDPRLRVARLATPRTRVPKGAVAIADDMSAIYPQSSAGGWHLIGHTDINLFDASLDSPSLLQPGDRVRFVRCG